MFKDIYINNILQFKKNTFKINKLIFCVVESAAVASFTLNNIASEVLVVNESEAVSVELECKVSGKPLPTIKLTQPDGAVLASSVSAGEVKFSLPPAVCEMMGPYTCAADNGVGTPDKMLRHLIVNCELPACTK